MPHTHGVRAVQRLRAVDGAGVGATRDRHVTGLVGTSSGAAWRPEAYHRSLRGPCIPHGRDTAVDPVTSDATMLPQARSRVDPDPA